MSNPNRNERPARAGFILVARPPARPAPAKEPPSPPALPAPEPAPVEQVVGVPTAQPAAAPDEDKTQVRHGLFEEVFFDGPLQLQLWWESEAPLHGSAIELR